MSERGWLRISEIFESIQGEGASAGAQSVFVRLATCNLRCAWCDTRYTWDWSAYDYAREVTRVAVADVAAKVNATDVATHLVVTGGEPLLQQPALVELLAALDPARHVEVETNGTLAPVAELVARVNQWNVSPKLGNSGESRERRIDVAALAALRDTGRAWLKLVVESSDDIAEVDALVAGGGWPAERVLLMPQASTRDALVERTPIVLRLAKERGFATSPRLHVERWSGRRGV
ncbi:MAG TPA: 7-carboxy-7-deazaguanine synthase QueE [Polyangiaceae bacterium]|jgi:organic radical activating enzyme|nr:7-carboxy-7-deazaguanine synthase QueE [Polyangiaceae bacterium]